jgi:RHS repeat-associated protein
LGPDGQVAERICFTWDGTRVAEQESLTSNGRVDVLTWDYEPNTWRAAAQRQRSWAANAPQAEADEAFHAIVTDLVGTPTELVTPEGRVAWRTAYSLFGEPITVSSPDGDECPLRFPGQYHDAETGLYYNLHRYYDPATAGYLSSDPLGLGPSPNDRRYVPNPLVWIDPLGLYPQDKYPPMSPAFKGDPYHPDEVAARIRANQDWPGRVPEPSAPSGDPTMIGANGTKITSQTAWNEGPYRIDVENPDPGGRPGQMHFQDQSNKSAKYYWDHQNGGFQGMPSKLADKLASNRGYQNGIKKGLNWLGESQ